MAKHKSKEPAGLRRWRLEQKRKKAGKTGGHKKSAHKKHHNVHALAAMQPKKHPAKKHPKHAAHHAAAKPAYHKKRKPRSKGFMGSISTMMTEKDGLGDKLIRSLINITAGVLIPPGLNAATKGIQNLAGYGPEWNPLVRSTLTLAGGTAAYFFLPKSARKHVEFVVDHIIANQADVEIESLLPPSWGAFVSGDWDKIGDEPKQAPPVYDRAELGASEVDRNGMLIDRTALGDDVAADVAADVADDGLVGEEVGEEDIEIAV